MTSKWRVGKNLDSGAVQAIDRIWRWLAYKTVFQAKSLDEITKGAWGTPTSQGQGDMENSAEEAETSGH